MRYVTVTNWNDQNKQGFPATAGNPCLCQTLKCKFLITMRDLLPWIYCHVSTKARNFPPFSSR